MVSCEFSVSNPRIGWVQSSTGIPIYPHILGKKPHILGKNHVKTMASTFFHIFPFVSSGNINPLVPGSSLGTTPPAPAGAQLELPTSRELSFLGVPWMRTGTGGPL